MKLFSTAQLATLATVSAISSEFGYLVDHGRAIECAELFAPDARLVFGPGTPRPGTLEGVDAIRTFLSNRQAQTHVTTRHVATNFRMAAEGEGVVLESLLTVFRSDDASRVPAVSVVAAVRERFTRTASGAWQIQERSTTPIFLHAGS